MSDRPIGMFDSGFGGLTVARATLDLLPGEDLVYLGDTARYPYGPRPLDDVRRFAVEVAEHLLDRYDVKLLVVACNTATAAALDLLIETLPIPVIGVIEPGIGAAVQASASGRLAVIGTVGTIASGAYELALEHHVSRNGSRPPSLVTCACPGLVEFVERGVTAGAEVELLVQRLLAPVVAADVDALLLGCTHYPFLARVIGDAVGRQVVLVSSADETAFAVADLLARTGLARPPSNRPGRPRFISSGDIRAFTELGSRLLGPELIDAEQWRPAASTGQPPPQPSPAEGATT